ncbi:MAG: hypothetical protein WC699_14895 [Bacteroidales bacterium]|jgi:hypothetical protein
MKNTQVLARDAWYSVEFRPSPNILYSAPVPKARKVVRTVLYLAVLAAILIGFSACYTSGYVTTRPVYIEHSRPVQPSTLHVWVNNDWSWSQPRHTYVQREGYWQRPAQGHVYVSGQWKESPKGQSWSKGKWKRNK